MARTLSGPLAGVAGQHLGGAERLHLDGGVVDAKALLHQPLGGLEHGSVVGVTVCDMAQAQTEGEIDVLKSG